MSGGGLPIPSIPHRGFLLLETSAQLSNQPHRHPNHPHLNLLPGWERR